MTTNFNRAFFISILINSIFVFIQIIFSIVTNSTSLLADAVHNLGDVLSLVVAWIAMILMHRQPTDTTTFGLKKSSILAALINGILLVFSCGIIFTEATYKFFSPQEIHSLTVIIVAGIGVLVNGATALLFKSDTDDLNVRGAYLHLYYDALISLGVVIAALLIYWTNWVWLDPLVAIIIACIILKGTWSLFRDSLHLILDAVPRSISLSDVRNYLISIPGVEGIHDLHIWALSTKENALSAHIYMPERHLSDVDRKHLVESIKKRYPIHHITLQIDKERDECIENCNE